MTIDTASELRTIAEMGLVEFYVGISLIGLGLIGLLLAHWGVDGARLVWGSSAGVVWGAILLGSSMAADTRLQQTTVGR